MKNDVHRFGGRLSVIVTAMLLVTSVIVLAQERTGREKTTQKETTQKETTQKKADQEKVGLEKATAPSAQSPEKASLESPRPALLTKSSTKPLGKDLKWKVTKPDLSKPVLEADNSYCLVCHINLEEEELVAIHLPVGVGCETCHGISDDHSADEDSYTAPEIMWSRGRINARCLTCHVQEAMLKNEKAAESHRKIFEHLKAPKTADSKEKTCVQCHGKHRIRNRTRQWDKETGKLLKQTGGPAMDR